MPFVSPAALPPAPLRRPTRLVAHGDVRIDDYYWLRNRTDPAVIAYLQAENDYAGAAMADTAALQESLFQEMRGRIRETDSTAPVADGGYWYYQRTVAGLDYPIYCRRAGTMAAPEEVLLDVNQLAEGNAFCEVGEFVVSPDHRLLAYAYDVDGNELFTIVIKDLTTGALLDDRIAGAYYGLEWSNDSCTLFYTTVDAQHRPDSVWRHDLGNAQTADTRLLHETDERFFVALYKTRSKRFIVVQLRSNMTTEAHVIDADAPTVPRLITARRQGHEYRIDHRGNHFYILTNHQAEDFCVMVAPVNDPALATWQPLVPEEAGILIDRIELFQAHLVALEWAGGVKRVRVLRLAPEAPVITAAHWIAFPEEVYAVSVAENPTFAVSTLRLEYSSLKTPPTVYAYDMETQRLEVLKQDEIANYNPDHYETRRLWATAPDGIQAPISLVCHKDTVLDGSSPCLLYGYGAYGASTEPGFRANRLSLLERGFVFAIAHIRGGSELGRAWYRNGKLRHKQNTFTDFIAAAEALIGAGYTRPDRLTIMGRSAGGLLMGAVTNQRPDLFAGVIAGVPFVDVLTTMLDPSIPLTVIEYEEWGNPADPELYAAMRAYSPYDNLAPRAYPPLLATAGLHDPRVGYWEPAKYVARLRQLKTDDNIVLLKTNMVAGHGGASGRYEYLRETAFEYAFLLKVVGKA
ncbi:MAG TPA: oligopeptidase B [Chloroflexi bacterium]|nr:oligopeptidase B [Chloroflexota bacterium]HHW88961.1 S9 family peptidase [Chloroflexota bacterium]